jgi:hypothetical protein
MSNNLQRLDSKGCYRVLTLGVVSGEERKAAAGEATKAMTGTQAATKGAGNKENKAAPLKSMVKEAEGKPKAAQNIKKPNGPKDKHDDKAKGNAGQVSAKSAGTRAHAGASGRVYAGAKSQLVKAKVTTVPTLSTAKMAAVPLTVKANATAKQKKEPVKKIPSPIPAHVSASCALDIKGFKGTEIMVEQEDSFEEILVKHSQSVPQRVEVAKENEEEDEFDNVDWKIILSGDDGETLIFDLDGNPSTLP